MPKRTRLKKNLHTFTRHPGRPAASLRRHAATCLQGVQTVADRCAPTKPTGSTRRRLNAPIAAHPCAPNETDPSVLGLLPKIPLYQSFYHLGFPRMLPFSVVISLSYRCNSTCATCDVWKKPNDDMTPQEWRNVFRHLGHTPFYMTFTGGEPFLRADMHEVVIGGYEECLPEVITIPTNGILTKRILERVAQICDAAPKAKVGINLSLDGVGADHDEIRGVPGNWIKSMQTWQGLKELQKTKPNLVLTVHTVLSKFNVKKAQAIYDGLQFLQ